MWRCVSGRYSRQDTRLLAMPLLSTRPTVTWWWNWYIRCREVPRAWSGCERCTHKGVVPGHWLISSWQPPAKHRAGSERQWTAACQRTAARLTTPRRNVCTHQGQRSRSGTCYSASYNLTLDLQSKGHEFDSRSGRYQVVATWMGECLYTSKSSLYITNHQGQLSYQALLLWLFKIPPHPTSVSALPAKKTKQVKYALKWTKASINFISPDLWPPTALSPFAYNVCSGIMQQRVYRTLFKNVHEHKKWLVEVWSRTLSTLLSMNGESICVAVFTQRADISNIFCKQLDNWTIG